MLEPLPGGAREEGAGPIFPLGNLLPKTRVLERYVLERKRKRFRNAGKRQEPNAGISGHVLHSLLQGEMKNCDQWGASICHLMLG